MNILVRSLAALFLASALVAAGDAGTGNAAGPELPPEYIRNARYGMLREFWASSFLGNNLAFVVKGDNDLKFSKDVLYTFFINNCAAVIVDRPDGFFLGHGYPVTNPRDSAFQAFREKLHQTTRWAGDIYIIANDPKMVANGFPPHRTYKLYVKPETSIASIKAVKENGALKVMAEFHPSAGVNSSAYDKLVAMMPWGELVHELKFEDYAVP